MSHKGIVINGFGKKGIPLISVGKDNFLLTGWFTNLLVSLGVRTFLCRCVDTHQTGSTKHPRKNRNFTAILHNHHYHLNHHQQ